MTIQQNTSVESLVESADLSFLPWNELAVLLRLNFLLCKELPVVSAILFESKTFTNGGGG